MDVLKIERLEGKPGLRLVGELDVETSKALRAELAALEHGSESVTLDLADLTFIDSSGMHVVVDYARSNGEHGPVVLEGVSQATLRLFEITDLTRHPGLDIRARADGA